MPPADALASADVAAAQAADTAEPAQDAELADDAAAGSAPDAAVAAIDDALPAPGPAKPGDFCPPPRVLRPLGTYRVPLTEEHEIVSLPRPMAFHRLSARPSPWPGLALGAASLLAAAMLGLGIRHRVRLPPPAPEPIKDGDPVFALPAQPLETPLLTGDERARLTWGAGRYLSEFEGSALDLPASADATVRRGGVPTPRFQRRRLERAIWIVEDLDPSEPLVAPLAREIVTELRLAGVPCRHLRFFGAPDTLADDRDQEQSLDDLEDEARHAAIAVVTGGALLSGRDGSGAAGAAAALRQMGHWPRVCVVDVTRGRWGLDRLVRRIGLRWLLPEQLPVWLEDPEVDFGPPSPPPEDALNRWAALCALAPLEASWQDAVALLLDWQRERRGGAGLRALHLPDLLRRSVREDRVVPAPKVRARELKRLREGAAGLCSWASGWWQKRMKKEADAREAREPEWARSPAGLAYAAAGLVMDVAAGRRLNVAVHELHRLRQGALQGWIDAHLERMALRGEAHKEGVEELPFGPDALGRREQAMLAATPVKQSGRLPRGLGWPAVGVAACAAMVGVGAGGLADGARWLLPADAAPITTSVLVPWFGPGLDMVIVPGGTFCMGSPEDEHGRDDDESPLHLVRLDGFAIAKTETTVGQIRAWLAQGGKMKSAPAPDKDASLPAAEVSWDEARAFCLRYGLDLPTEAQWEYSARAGTTTRFSFGDDEAQLDRFAWLGGASAHPVGSKEPNNFRLYDMHGNVWEWAQDRYGRYEVDNAREPIVNPSGPTEQTVGGVRVVRGGVRVVRGGSFWYGPWWLRSADRFRSQPGSRVGYLGFRCAGPVRRQP